MAHKSRIAFICAALLVVGACNKQSGPAAAVASNHYQGVGVVKAIDSKKPAIEIDHGDIDGLMPAMQMEFPVTDVNLLNGIAVNDRIDFTIEAAKGQMKVIAIKKK